jgi:hypothetical protein
VSGLWIGDSTFWDDPGTVRQAATSLHLGQAANATVVRNEFKGAMLRTYDTNENTVFVGNRFEGTFPIRDVNPLTSRRGTGWRAGART